MAMVTPKFRGELTARPRRLLKHGRMAHTHFLFRYLGSTRAPLSGYCPMPCAMSLVAYQVNSYAIGRCQKKPFKAGADLKQLTNL